MGNLAEEIASRGSKLCMQICVNNTEDDIIGKKVVRKSRKHLLDNLLGYEDINWLSPRTLDNYKEYQLEDIAEKFPSETGLSDMDWSFWNSKRKPQWDAIGVAEDGTLIIVEAKAHISEIESSGSQARGDSLNQIKQEIEKVLGSDPVWLGKYYQTANRILYLSKLKQYYGKKRKVILVFLNFINDVTYKPEPEELWRSYLSDMKEKHPLPSSLSSSIKYVFMDLWKDSGI